MEFCPPEWPREYLRSALCCEYLHRLLTVRAHHQTELYALLPSFCRAVACFFEPASGDLVIQPCIDNHEQSMVPVYSQVSDLCSQYCLKTSALRHSRKRQWMKLNEHIPVAFRAFHLYPVLRTKNMAFIAARLSTYLLWVPKGWLFLYSRIRVTIFSQSHIDSAFLLPYAYCCITEIAILAGW